MFEVAIGKEGLNRSWQASFPETTKCVHCPGEARIGFTVVELPNSGIPIEKQRFVAQLHPNDPDGQGFWLHDCCAVATYFCKMCLFPTSLYNQG